MIGREIFVPSQLVGINFFGVVHDRTVYRTLPLLLESGVIKKSVGEGKRDFYERTSVKGHHDHMVCVRCGKIIEFTCDEIEELQDKVCEDHSFKLIFHDHRLFGACKDCQ